MPRDWNRAPTWPCRSYHFYAEPTGHGIQIGHPKARSSSGSSNRFYPWPISLYFIKGVTWEIPAPPVPCPMILVAKDGDAHILGKVRSSLFRVKHYPKPYSILIHNLTDTFPQSLHTTHRDYRCSDQPPLLNRLDSAGWQIRASLHLSD